MDANSTDMQAEVARWMRAFGQDVPDKPCIPSRGVLELRANLIEEEGLRETVEALRDLQHYDGTFTLEALVNIADGLCDSRFVIDGTFVALGLDSGPLFAEVCRSNWTKLWTEREIAEKTSADFWRSHTAVEINTPEARCFLVKRNDGKIIKSPSYSPANLLPLIEAQMKGKV